MIESIKHFAAAFPVVFVLITILVSFILVITSINIGRKMPGGLKTMNLQVPVVLLSLYLQL